MNDPRQRWSRENVWSIGRCPEEKRREERRREEKRTWKKRGTENVAELWKMTIEFRDSSVARSVGGGEDAVFMRARVRPPIAG